MNFSDVKALATQMESADQTRNEMFRALDEQFLCIDGDLPQGEWIKETVSPDSRNAVQGAARLLTAGDPIFSVPRESNPPELRKKSSLLERAAASIWKNAGLTSGRPRHYDPVLSALMYAEVQIPIISTKRLAETMKGKARERWDRVAEKSPVLFDCVNPREGHSIWGIGGLDAYYSKRLQTVAQVRSRFGQDVMAGKAINDTATLHEFWNLEQHVIWAEGEDTPLMDEENPWPFIPVVSVLVEGSQLFSVDSTYQTRQPFLYTVWKTGIWKRMNLFLTLMSSLAFEVGSNPMLVFESVSQDMPRIDYSHPGAMIKINQGEKIYPLMAKAVTPDMLEQFQVFTDRHVKSTIYPQVLGEPISGGSSTYSETALLSQAGKLPLVVYQKMLSFAVTQAMQMAFHMVKADGGVVQAKDKSGLIALDADEIPDDFDLQANLDISMPQDDRVNAQIATQLTNPSHPLVSDRYAQETILRIGAPDEMAEEIQEERYINMFAQLDLQGKAQQKQMEMQQQQQLMAMQQQQQQGGMAGGAPGGQAGGEVPPGPPPEMMGPPTQQAQPGLPQAAPAEPMGSPMGPGGMPPDETAMM